MAGPVCFTNRRMGRDKTSLVELSQRHTGVRGGIPIHVWL